MGAVLAHIGGSGGHDHLLIEHSHSVAKLARQMALDAAQGNEQLARLAEWAGWLHDLGKYRDEFQAYLKGRRQKGIETQHAVFGSAWAWNQALPLAVSLAVLGHHAGLHDRSSAQDRLTSSELNPAAAAGPLAERLRTEASALGLELPAPCAEFIPRKRVQPQPEFRHELWIRVLFSCLTDADYLDTEEYMQGQGRSPMPLDAGELFARVRRYVENLSSSGADNDVNKIRSEIFRACVERSGRGERLLRPDRADGQWKNPSHDGVRPAPCGSA